MHELELKMINHVDKKFGELDTKFDELDKKVALVDLKANISNRCLRRDYHIGCYSYPCSCFKTSSTKSP